MESMLEKLVEKGLELFFNLFIILGPIFFAVLIVCASLGKINGVQEDYSTGQAIGKLMKCSERGLFWKSYECNMYMYLQIDSSNKKNGSIATEIFYFSLPHPDKNKDMILKINKFIGKDVKVDYKQWLLSPYYIDSSFVITDISEYGKSE